MTLDERLNDARSEYESRFWPVPETADHSGRAAPSRRRLALAGAAIAVCVALVAVAATRRGDSSGDVVAGPSTTEVSAPTAAGTDGLAAALVDPAAPPEPRPVQPGWKLIDYGDFRFAVPADWQIAISRSCWQPSSDPQPSGVLFLRSSPTGDEPTCSPEQPLPASVLTLEGGHPASEIQGEATTVGTFTAVRSTGPSCAAPACPTNQYSLGDGFLLSITSPLEDQVLDTFTMSGRDQALHSGPLADDTSWQPVTDAGVRAEVPPSWQVIDLPASYYEHHGPDGAVMSGGQLNPGECSGVYFNGAPDAASTAYLGFSPIVPSCPYAGAQDLSPADGIWIRPYNAQREPAIDVERSVQIGTATVELLETSDRLTVPVIDLRIETPSGTTLVSIGVGTDPSIARAILASVGLV